MKIFGFCSVVEDFGEARLLY